MRRRRRLRARRVAPRPVKPAVTVEQVAQQRAAQLAAAAESGDVDRAALLAALKPIPRKGNRHG